MTAGLLLSSSFSNELYKDILAARNEIQESLREVMNQHEQEQQQRVKNSRKKKRGLKFSRPAEQRVNLNQHILTPRDELNLSFVSDVNVLVENYQQKESRLNKTSRDYSTNHYYNHLFAQIFYKYLLKGEMGTLLIDLSDEVHQRLSRHYATLTGNMKMIQTKPSSSSSNSNRNHTKEESSNAKKNKIKQVSSSIARQNYKKAQRKDTEPITRTNLGGVNSSAVWC